MFGVDQMSGVSLEQDQFSCKETIPEHSNDFSNLAFFTPKLPVVFSC